MNKEIPAKEGFVSFRGYSVWHRIVGDHEGPRKLPLLCLHGGVPSQKDRTSNQESFRHLLGSSLFFICPFFYLDTFSRSQYPIVKDAGQGEGRGKRRFAWNSIAGNVKYGPGTPVMRNPLFDTPIIERFGLTSGTGFHILILWPMQRTGSKAPAQGDLKPVLPSMYQAKRWAESVLRSKQTWSAIQPRSAIGWARVSGDRVFVLLP